jgi:hypothetical protein
MRMVVPDLTAGAGATDVEEADTDTAQERCGPDPARELFAEEKGGEKGHEDNFQTKHRRSDGDIADPECDHGEDLAEHEDKCRCRRLPP